MIIDQRYLGQEELKYVYERGKKEWNIILNLQRSIER